MTMIVFSNAKDRDLHNENNEGSKSGYFERNFAFILINKTLLKKLCVCNYGENGNFNFFHISHVQHFKRDEPSGEGFTKSFGEFKFHFAPELKSYTRFINICKRHIYKMNF